MATFVNFLRLTELATGEGSGTWGTTTNQSLELIGEALGYATQQAFGSDADATTTVADGASDPARAMYYKITSAASLTATRTLTIAPNTISRVMFIENATSGSQSIAISQGSGASVTIAAGKTAVVYLDGAGATAAVVDAMSGVDPGVTDTLTEVLVAGNTSGGTNIELSTTDKVQFRDAAIYINSSVDGQLDIVADTEIQIAATTVDLNGNLDVSGTTVSAGKITADAGIDIDNINIDGTTIALSSGDLTLDVAGDIILDAAGTQVILKKAGTQFGEFLTSSTPDNLYIKSSIQDKDIIFGGNDGGSPITALTLDMSEAGAATFNSTIAATSATFTTADNLPQLTLVSTDADALVGPQLNLWRNSGSAANGDLIGQITFTGEDSLSNTITYASIHGVADQVDNGAEDGSIRFSTRFNDVLAERLAITQLGGVTINDTGIDADFRVESDTNTHALFVQGSDGFVGINESNPLTLLHLKSSSAGEILRIESTEGGTSDGPILGLYRNSASPADGDGLGTINFYGEDSAGNTTTYGQIRAESSDVSNGTEDGLISLRTVVDGSVIARINLIPSEAVFNESGADLDFRVESDGSTHAIFVDASTNRVGILNSSPSKPLEVTSNDFQIRLSTASDPASYYTQFISAYDSTNPFRMEGYYNGTSVEPIKITAAGGFSSPVLRLGEDMSYVSLYTGSTERVVLENTGLSINEGGADFDFRVESDTKTHALFVDGGTGNVLIGTSTIAYAGTLLNIGTTSDSQNGIQITTSTTGNGYILFGDGSGADAYRGQIHYTHSDDSMAFMTAAVVRAKFSSSETVFNDVSTDTDFRVESDGNANMLFVDASANTVNIGGTAAGTNVISMDAGRIRLHKSSDWNIESDGGTAHIRFLQSGVENGSITTNGTNTTYATSSDYRLKENIVDAPSASDDIDAIRVRSFDWKANGSHQVYGLIAQELLPILPNSVAQGEKEEDMMGVDYSKLVPMLIKEIQSLRARVADLES